MSLACSQEELENRIQTLLQKRTLENTRLVSSFPMSLHKCSVDERWAEFRHEVTDSELNSYDCLHGGATSWLFDTSFGLLLKAYSGKPVTLTMDIHIHFLKPIRRNDHIIIHSQITHLSRTIAYMRSEIWTNEQKHLSATASAVFYYKDKS